MESPIGKLTLVSEGESLTGIYMFEHKGGVEIADDWLEDADALPLLLAKKQLQEYFACERTEFSLPLKPVGTEFQRSVWQELCKIGYGETISYGELARRVGNPAAVRAVASANARNPISIVVPCHRVIGHNGKLTGYAGGLARKEALLGLESNKRLVAGRT
ncbi:MAG: methylated-DNA--[protein]-cysteine S-methyltransferase [Candidatus Obscuribacterales bacterium]|nr:methylated-DNA--[protein]-cysteine S-methyltransferase [Candidatus Obscuribacterales bacterium]